MIYKATCRKGSRSVVLAAVALLFVAACGSASGDQALDDSQSESSISLDSSQAVGSGSDADDAGVEVNGSEGAETFQSVEPNVTEGIWPREIEHALGTTLVESRPLRIVALDMSVVDSTLALQNDLVGYTTFASPNGPLPDRFSSASEYSSDALWVGDLLAPNMELIAGLQPDLIVSAAVRHEDIYEELSMIAPTIMADSAGGGWAASLRLVGQATGTEERAAALLADFEGRAIEVGSAINESAGEPTISVVRFVEAIRLYQPTSFVGGILATAGLARPASQQETEDFISIISEEEMSQADGDVLLYAVYENEAVQKLTTQILDRPLWSSLQAVQDGRAFPVSDQSWMSGVGIFGAHLVLDDLAEIFNTPTFNSTFQEQS